MHDNISYISSDIKDFSPTVLLTTYFKSVGIIKPNTPMDARYCYDYELEFYTHSDGGKILIEGISYPTEKDTLILRKPGQYVQGITSYNCFLVCFDLLNNTGKVNSSYIFYSPQPFQNYIMNPILESIPHKINPIHPSHYYKLFNDLLKLYINQEEAAPLMMRAILSQIIYHLHEDTKNAKNGVMTHSLHKDTVREALNYIHLYYNEKITLESLAKITHLSTSHFHRIFKESMGITPIEYIIKYRIEIAQDFLLKENASVASIAQRCGFQNVPYFYDLFKRKTGLTPTELRQKQNYMSI